AQPGHQAVHAALPDRDLRQRPAQHHGNLVRRVAGELWLQVLAHERRPPAKLHDVHALADHLHQRVHLRDRQAPVDHVRQPPLARLGRALGYVQEAGYGVEEALSRPTITTTLAEPAIEAKV